MSVHSPEPERSKNGILTMSVNKHSDGLISTVAGSTCGSNSSCFSHKNNPSISVRYWSCHKIIIIERQEQLSVLLNILANSHSESTGTNAAEEKVCAKAYISAAWGNIGYISIPSMSSFKIKPINFKINQSLTKLNEWLLCLQFFKYAIPEELPYGSRKWNINRNLLMSHTSWACLIR